MSARYLRSLVCCGHDEAARSQLAFSALPHRDEVASPDAREHSASPAALREGERVDRVRLRVRQQARRRFALVGVVVEQGRLASSSNKPAASGDLGRFSRTSTAGSFTTVASPSRRSSKPAVVTTSSPFRFWRAEIRSESRRHILSAGGVNKVVGGWV